MFDILFFHIRQKVTLTDADKEIIKTFFTEKKLKKKQYLLQEGNVCKHMAFVAKGLLKTYNVEENGEEHVSLFGWEGWWLSDLNSFITGDTSIFNIDAIENSELLLITKEAYERLTIKVPIMDRYFQDTIPTQPYH